MTIRLLDPPLHEFLPTVEATDAIETLAAESGVPVERVLEKIRSLHEVTAAPKTRTNIWRLSVAFTLEALSHTPTNACPCEQHCLSMGPFPISCALLGC